MTADPRKPDLSDSLLQTLAHSELPSVGADVTEVLLDAELVDGLIKDLPVIGTLRGLYKTGAAVKDWLFQRKLASFLLSSDLSAIPTEKRRQMLDSLQAADTAEHVGEKVLTLLDRLESPQKARLLAKTLALYISKAITGEEFWRVSFVIERLPLRDIIALRDWRTLKLDHVEHIRKHLYLSVGVGWWVDDMSSTGFQWQERLCAIVSDHLVSTSGPLQGPGMGE